MRLTEALLRHVLELRFEQLDARAVAATRVFAMDSLAVDGLATDGPAVLDWRAWAQAYVSAQWAIVDRDNKRAATADCLDEIARIRK